MIISTVASKLLYFSIVIFTNSVMQENYSTFFQAVLWMAVKHQDKVKNTKSRSILFFFINYFYFLMILESYPDLGQRNSGQWDWRDTRYGIQVHHLQSFRSGFGIIIMYPDPSVSDKFSLLMIWFAITQYFLRELDKQIFLKLNYRYVCTLKMKFRLIFFHILYVSVRIRKRALILAS